MDKKIIGITGLLSSGKGTAAEYLVKKYGAVSFRFSTMLRDVLDRLYIEQSRANLSHISTVLRQQFGDDLLSQVLAHDAERAEHSLIVIEGIRRDMDIVYLKNLPGFILVSIIADEKVRYQRLIGRGENSDDASKTWEQFLTDHTLETEVSIPAVMEQASVHIDNKGSHGELQRQLDSLMTKIQDGSKV